MNPRDELKAFLDGELTPARVELVQHALHQDPSLQRELEDMKRISASLKAMARPVETSSAAIPNLAAPSTPMPRRVLHPVGWAAVAACALAALGALGGVILPQVPFAPASGTMASQPAAQMPGFESTSSDRPMASGMGSAQSGTAEIVTRERVDATPTGGSGMTGNPTARSGAIADGRIVDQRQIIKAGDMTVRVKDVDAAAETVSLLATGLGGFVEQKNMMRSGSASATLILRIPAAQFDNARSQVAALGTVLNESQSGQDVTLDVADLGARMQTLKAELDAYNALLRRAQTTGEIMTIQRQASQVRQEYEGIKAQVAAMKNMARMSTLAVTLMERTPIEEPAPGDWFEEALRSALNLALGFGKLIVIGLLFVVILSPFWAPFAIFAWVRARRTRND